VAGIARDRASDDGILGTEARDQQGKERRRRRRRSP